MSLCSYVLAFVLMISVLGPIVPGAVADPVQAAPASRNTTTAAANDPDTEIGKLARPVARAMIPLIEAKLKDERTEDRVGDNIQNLHFWPRVNRLWKRTEGNPAVRELMRRELEEIAQTPGLHNENLWAFIGLWPGLAAGFFRSGPAAFLGLPLGLLTAGAAKLTAHVLNGSRIDTLARRLDRFEREVLPRLEASIKNPPQAVGSRTAPTDPMGDLPQSTEAR